VWSGQEEPVLTSDAIADLDYHNEHPRNITVTTP
jgi:hypothetical protein